MIILDSKFTPGKNIGVFRCGDFTRLLKIYHMPCVAFIEPTHEIGRMVCLRCKAPFRSAYLPTFDLTKCTVESELLNWVSDWTKIPPSQLEVSITWP